VGRDEAELPDPSVGDRPEERERRGYLRLASEHVLASLSVENAHASERKDTQYERGRPSTCWPRYARTRLFETGATE
jgi:hypothetical protein